MGKRVVILGGGESGYGTALLAKNEGYEVFLSDRGLLAEKYRNYLIDTSIDFEEGGHTIERIIGYDIAVKSPGIPDSAEVIVALKEADISVISEMEFAYNFCKSKIISITGSNGKTTTSILTAKILKEGGVDVVLAGNIGDSFARSVACDNPEWYVLELSSFQLDGCFDFKSDIAVLTNITPDHLDRYNYDMSLYTQSKFRIALNQSDRDIFIVNATDSVTTSFLQSGSNKLESNIVNINKPNCDVGGYISDDRTEIVCNYNNVEVRIPISDIKIKGQHNYSNIMDSILVALAVGVAPDSIIKSVTSFGGVEHRMEFVAEIDGVTYINDSKATNVDSSWYALESMTTPTVWIAGGTDKGNCYDTLLDLARANVRVLVCMGIDNSKIIKAFGGVVDSIYDTHSIDETFEVIKSVVKSGDTVLLSPCSASFDLFKNYEDRGEQFKCRVRGLK